ncbi:M16 family metallopeptidase [Archangium lipolyticum]|uniref:M16 family metallopeptidase n=1 Tax=Archangium lipolyticum TaxID=2970465 RepID=UPI002149BAD2|nr:insulinase family protein [Archangium lipolyticum]
MRSSSLVPSLALPWAVALFLLASPASAAPFEVESLRPSPQHPLLLLAPRETSRSTLTIVFDVGFLDDDVPGLTRVAQQALLHANSRGDYATLMREVYSAGASFDLRTGLHESRFTLSAHPDDFDALARRLLTAILSPRLDSRRFEATLERASRDGNALDSEDWLELLLARALHDDGRYRNPDLGSMRYAEDIVQEQVRLHLSRMLAPCNATVIATGRFDAAALRKLVAGFKGGVRLERTRPKLPLPFRRQVRSARELQVLAYPVHIESARDSAALRVIASLLQERLFQRIRDAGQGYSVASEPLLTATFDALLLLLPASAREGIDLGAALREEVRTVREATFESGAFERHRQATLTRLRLSDRDPSALAQELRFARHRPAWYSPELEATLAALTVKDVQEVASRWLDESTSAQLHFVTRTEEEEKKDEETEEESE